MVSPAVVPKLLVIATRLHLGKASSPPTASSLQETVRSLVALMQQPLPVGLKLQQVVIAVDATPKFPNYDLVQAVQDACHRCYNNNDQGDTTTSSTTADDNNSKNKDDDDNTHHQLLHVLPVTPWGMFVPALNALVGHALSTDAGGNGGGGPADYILFVSAESCDSSEGVLASLWQHMDPNNNDNNPHDTLVCGAVLPGHDYTAPSSATNTTAFDDNNNNQADGGVKRELNGRTTPWNTMALWNLRSLALTGFLLLSDGLVDPDAYGVEEVLVIALLQKLLGPEQARAKLIAVPGVAWHQDFDGDEQRRAWHEEKMKSKFTRAQRQLDRMGLLQQGLVYHY